MGEKGGDKRRDGGSQSQTGFNLLEDALFCFFFVIVPPVINIYDT